MKWTQENEHLLLKVMFETQNMHIDFDKISSAWPGDVKPTPKALKEHLSKYRGKGQGSVTFGMSSRSAPSTPRRKSSANKSAGGDEAGDNDVCDDGAMTPVTPTKRGASGEAATPRKRRATKKTAKETEIAGDRDQA
ncbi:hypothetical protein P170DRAFT_471587 [Aspergillus steynii IBT 23096]|uniref:AT hook motif protein n=1 Tax=Aspergillus steynii IBT 23096 TaxID=1392250 RepID=A0A2I2GFJ6_9EURO|nr:uncharacterized protein P170DRAFT_471587 [Aspergillus steynii IBT 23096]PLB51658.1 hypothetical protein P170DRAFT_471587 [Aspergillus steynii IBT 23096]